MTAIATNTDGLRLEAARIAFALIRFEEVGDGITPSPSAAVPPSGSPAFGSGGTGYVAPILVRISP